MLFFKKLYRFIRFTIVAAPVVWRIYKMVRPYLGKSTTDTRKR